MPIFLSCRRPLRELSGDPGDVVSQMQHVDTTFQKSGRVRDVFGCLRRDLYRLRAGCIGSGDGGASSVSEATAQGQRTRAGTSMK